MKPYIKFILLSCAAVCLLACANKAQGPTGGPKDETPPKVMKSTPLNGALNFRKKEVVIVFDENVSLEKTAENVLISPPQRQQPEVKSNGKTVTISFSEPLMDSTTYTINFGNAIVDLNEKNPLKNYRFSFSTGNEIDTLQIAGTLLNAEDLNPVSSTLVGIYRETADSVFTQKPFLRIGKTDENGHFTIDNIKGGTYKVFALADADRNYFYSAGEALAMYDSLVTPTFRIEEMHDTLWKDSLTIDTVKTYMGTHFLPDNLVLMFFKEIKKRQYFLKVERKIAESFTLIFNAPQSEMPEIKPLDFQWEGKTFLQKNSTLDTLTYWITDDNIFGKDTLVLQMTYMKSDSALNPVPQTDTVHAIYRRPKVNAKNRKDEIINNPVPAYKFQTNASNSFDIYNSLTFRFEQPLEYADLEKIHLSQKIDSIYKPLTLKWQAVDSSMMNFAVLYKWEAEAVYEITTDSLAFRSIYHRESDKYKGTFKIKSLDEYSAVKLFTAEFDSLLVFQILDEKDKVLRTLPAHREGTLFEYLKPGNYYMRAFRDENRNGKWDTGDFSRRRQPETVYYSPKKLSLRANWEFEETWDINALPVLQQKSEELKQQQKKK